MATTATATKLAGPGSPNMDCFVAVYKLLYDTTDASGQMTLDLTDDFSKIYAIETGGSTAATGYFTDFEIPDYDTAITATNVKVTILQSAGSAAVLAAKASTDMSAVITNQRIVVYGLRAI